MAPPAASAAAAAKAPTGAGEEGEARYKEYEKMDDVLGQAWVEDAEEVWRLAPVRSVSSDGGTLFVLQQDEETTYTVPKEKSHPFDPSHAIDMDDLANLNNMHEAPLLHVLRRRFKADKIYTCCSDVLISINPYKKIPLLYELDRETALPLLEQTAPVAPKLADDDLSGNGKAAAPASEARPHVYSVAARAFRFMTEPNEAMLLGKTAALKNQSIIISGESGAGKTEASKYVMRYLITVANALQSKRGAGAGSGSAEQHGDLIERCLLRSNTVLEAFGNAKTLRNDNSSRFGKYIKLQYDAKRQLVGAWTDHFLLEKSRLVHVDPDERNYHIFYEMLRGLPTEMLEELKLTGEPEDYCILAQGGCCALEDVDDAEEFGQVCEALATLGLSDEEIRSLWRLLAVLLHLGNLEYDWDETEGDPVTLSSQQVSLSDIAELLGVSPAKLIDGVTKRTTLTAGSILSIPLNLDQTRNNVQAVIKHVYGEAFHWILRKINSCHASMASATVDSKAAAAAAPASFIGILDIFGFEIMARNSFEQLCINYANEVLQQQFNMHVFVQEQQEYVAEELDWSVISFRDNQPVIDLVAKKPQGLLIMLEEQGLLGRKANNAALLTSYHNAHLGKVDCYAKPRFQSDEFIVKHFAGQVTYSTAGFLEKNNDSLHDDLLMLWRASDVPFFRALVSQGEASNGVDAPAPGTPGYIPPLPKHQRKQPGQSSDGTPERERKPVRGHLHGRVAGVGQIGGPGAISGAFTVSCTFRRQLEELTATLKATEPHYIKCIKPNTVKAPGGFSPRLVVQQLRYSGVLEVVRIRREAYPTRIPFEDFYRRFDVLLGSAKPTPGQLKTHQDYRTACQAIVTQVLPPGGFQLGKRKIFLRDNGLDLLRNAIRDFYAGHAARIQALVRGFLGVRRYARTRRALCLLQRTVRMHLLRKRFLRHKRQIVQIQARYRAHRSQKAYQALQRGALAAQRCTRRWLAMRVFSRKARALKQSMEDSATRLAAAFRGFVARRHFKRHRAATRINAAARGRLARRHARAVRAAVLITAHLRGHAARARYRRQQAAIVAIQAVARMRAARRELRRRKAALRIQTCARAWMARRVCCTLRTQARLKREREERQAALKIQSQWHAHKARTAFLELRAAAVVAQAYARMALAVRRRRQALAAVMTLQAAARGHQGRVAVRKLRAAIRLQALARGHLARQHYARLRAAIRIQAWARGRAARAEFLRQRAAARIQAQARGYLQRRAYLWLRAAIAIQAAFRGARARRHWREAQWAVRVLQGAVRRLLHEILESRRVHKLHLAARAGQVGTVARMLEERPWLALKRDRQSHFRTLLHSAALSDELSMVAFLNPRAEDLLARDGRGDTPLHLAARRGSLDLAKRFAAICDGNVEPEANRADSTALVPVPSSALALVPSSARVHAYNNQPGQRASFRIGSVGPDSWEDRRRAAKALSMSLASPGVGAPTPIPGGLASGRATPATLGGRRPAPGSMSAASSPGSVRPHSVSGAPSPNRPPSVVGFGAFASAGSMGGFMGGGVGAGGGAGKHGSRRTPVPNMQGGFDGLSWEEVQLAHERAQAARAEATLVQLHRIKAGWLRKRRETDRWNRRWCVLTDTELRYYHAPQGCPASKVIKLKAAMLKVCEHQDFCFEIHSPLLLDRRNREGRLYFQAESEMELQAWLAKLRLVMGQTTHMYGRRAQPIRYVDLEARRQMVACTNDKGETPLHALVRSVATRDGRETKRAAQVRLLEFAMWLVEAGADLDTQDDDGNTAAHVAALAAGAGAVNAPSGGRGRRRSSFGMGVADEPGMSPEVRESLFRLIAALQQRGATLALRNHLHKTVHDLMAQSRAVAAAAVTATGAPAALASKALAPGQVKAAATRALFLPPQQRLPGCSYVSFFVEKLAMADAHGAERLSAPFLRFNVYSGKQHQVEPTQTMTSPAVQKGRAMWWGWAWHMQTPVEHLSPGSFAVIELIDRLKGPQAWALLHVDDSRVDSGPLNLEMYRCPVDLKMQRIEPGDFFLTGEMWVTRGDTLALPAIAEAKARAEQATVDGDLRPLKLMPSTEEAIFNHGAPRSVRSASRSSFRLPTPQLR